MKRSSYHLPAPSSKEQVSSLQAVNKMIKDRKILLVLIGCIIGTVLSANLCLSDVRPFNPWPSTGKWLATTNNNTDPGNSLAFFIPPPSSWDEKSRI